MKQNCMLPIWIGIILMCLVGCSEQDEFLALKGPYLGQKPPGMTPELFAPGIITTDISEGCSGWGNDMEYFIFQRWIDRKPRLYTAPDESYMIYCSMMPGGLGDDDLYITFKTADGSWSEPVHMGAEINTDKSENRPYVSPDGKYFFYTSTIRGNRDIYWVDAKIIEDLKQKELKLRRKTMKPKAIYVGILLFIIFVF